MLIFTVLKQGQHYLNTWPLVPKLAMIFPENRIIKATRFAQKFMPFIAVFAIVWQQVYARGDIIALAAVGLTAIFALCIPLQGLYWLGKRANTPLSAQSAVCFYKIFDKLQGVNAAVPIIKDKPTYQHLAEVLNKADTCLDKSFWDEI